MNMVMNMEMITEAPPQSVELDRASLGARRALVRIAQDENKDPPFSPESLAKAVLGEGRWSDAFGIDEEDVHQIATAADQALAAGDTRQAKELFGYLILLDRYDPIGYLGVGVALLEEQNHEAAAHAFNGAIATFGGDLGAHAGRAICFLELGDTDGAKQDMMMALELDPEGQCPLTGAMAKRMVSHFAAA